MGNPPRSVESNFTSHNSKRRKEEKRKKKKVDAAVEVLVCEAVQRQDVPVDVSLENLRAMGRYGKEDLMKI